MTRSCFEVNRPPQRKGKDCFSTMSDDDFISALTQEVKEEVIRNYLYERRLLEEQIHYLEELAEMAKALQKSLSNRFARIQDQLMEQQFMDQFLALIGLKTLPFDPPTPDHGAYRKEVPFVKVRALTDRNKYKKLLVASYDRLYDWNEKYKQAYEELGEECRAVEHNLKKFENNHDLLTIIRFLKEMDSEMIQKKHFLGENFTAKELSAVENSLRFHHVSLQNFGLASPVVIPDTQTIKKQLHHLADCVFGECKVDVKQFVK